MSDKAEEGRAEMTPPALAVGSVVDVCRTFGSRAAEPMERRRTRIVGERAGRWIDATGAEFDKHTLSLVPRYIDFDTYLRPVVKEDASCKR